MKRILMGVCLTAIVGAVVWRGVAAAPAPPDDRPRVIRLAPQASAKQVSDLQYRLLPDPLARTPGNAAPLWRLAAEALRGGPRKFTEKERIMYTPLKDLPRREVKEFLHSVRGALRLAHEAARRERCDWEIPPLTLQSIQEYQPWEGVQRCREIAALLGVQYRLQLAEERYDAAAETLQTGFALARHLAESDLLIDDLVGIAIASIMMSHVEEWMQMPGSPNLYWSLTALPQPLLDVRRAVEQDLNTIHRSMPRLRELRQRTWTEREVDVLVEQFSSLTQGLVGKGRASKEWKGAPDLSKSAEIARLYPRARRHLIDLGRAEKEVDAMPKAQVVLLHILDEYDRTRDDFLKVLTLPSWQALPLMERAEKGFRGTDNPLLALLMPVLTKTFEARIRLERGMAGLRGAEALRQYAAAHEGKSPAKWNDITTVPLPLNPVTGKGFEDFYQVKNGRGTLEVPPPPGMPPSLARRFELALRRAAP
jgi:hypothetical protein